MSLRTNLLGTSAAGIEAINLASRLPPALRTQITAYAHLPGDFADLTLR